MTTRSSYCSLCGQEYQAPAHLKAYQNLCEQCWSADVLREWDRIDSTRRQMASGRADTLTLAEWMHTIAAFHGRCCLCLQVPFNRLTLLAPAIGLVAENVVPTCKACEYHLRHNFALSVERVQQAMNSEVVSDMYSFEKG